MLKAAFVSYAHADRELCDPYIDALRDRGVDLWYDRDNSQVADFLGEQIEKHLRMRSALILMMTENALASFWVRLERQTFLSLMADDTSRKLIAVRIGPCQVPPTINAFLWI